MEVAAGLGREAGGEQEMYGVARKQIQRIQRIAEMLDGKRVEVKVGTTISQRRTAGCNCHQTCSAGIQGRHRQGRGCAVCKGAACRHEGVASGQQREMRRGDVRRPGRARNAHGVRLVLLLIPTCLPAGAMWCAAPRAAHWTSHCGRSARWAARRCARGHVS